MGGLEVLSGLPSGSVVHKDTRSFHAVLVGNGQFTGQQSFCGALEGEPLLPLLLLREEENFMAFLARVLLRRAGFFSTKL